MKVTQFLKLCALSTPGACSEEMDDSTLDIYGGPTKVVVEVDDDKGEKEVMYMTRSSRRQMKFCYDVVSDLMFNAVAMC